MRNDNALVDARCTAMNLLRAAPQRRDPTLAWRGACWALLTIGTFAASAVACVLPWPDDHQPIMAKLGDLGVFPMIVLPGACWLAAVVCAFHRDRPTICLFWAMLPPPAYLVVLIVCVLLEH